MLYIVFMLLSCRKSRLLLQIVLICGSVFFLLSTLRSASFADDTTAVNDWTLSAPLPDTLADAQTVVISNTLFTVGGKTPNAASNQVASAELTADGYISLWKTLTSTLPISPYIHSVVAINQSIFVLGGYDGNHRFSTVYGATVDANSAINSWQAINDLPLKLVLHSVTTLNTCIFVLGGVNENNAPLSTVFRTTVNGNSLNNWIQDRSLPEVRFRAAAASYAVPTASSRGFIYLSGGFDGTNTSRAVFAAQVMWDCSLGEWKKLRLLPRPLHYHASVVYQNRLYVLGGKNEEYESSDVYFALISIDGTIGEWQQQPGLPLSLYRFGALLVENLMECQAPYLYILGGLHGEVYQSQVYRMSMSHCYYYLPQISN